MSEKGSGMEFKSVTQRDLSLPIPVLNLPVGDIIMSLCCDVRHAQSEQNGKEI